MWARTLRHLRTNAVAYVALFFALAGGAYAAKLAAKNSVNSRAIINGQVKKSDVAKHAIADSKLKQSRWIEFAPAPASGQYEPGKFVCRAGGANCSQYWTNYDPAHNTAAYFRDGFGIVHLRGLVKPVGESADGVTETYDNFIAVLPAGYRPARPEVQPTLQEDDVPGGVTINSGSSPNFGLIWTRTPVAEGEWFSLDGITFRCAPAGKKGCP